MKLSWRGRVGALRRPDAAARRPTYRSLLFKRIAPTRFISSSARCISPGSSSIPRHPSKMTHVVNPSWRASSALYLTAVVQRQTHKVDLLDRSFLQIMSKTGVSSMGVVEKRAVTGYTQQKVRDRQVAAATAPLAACVPFPVILSATKRSRRIPRNCLKVSPRDSSTSLGMTVTADR